MSDLTQDTPSAGHRFVYGAITRSGRPFQGRSTTKYSHMLESYNPGNKLPVWAVPISLATTLGISVLISFPGLMRCFSSPSIPPAFAGHET